MASRLVLPFADVGPGIKPSSGAKLFFFETGTSTPKNTFSDSAATTPNSNPVISDSTGVFADIFIIGTQKVVLKDKNDVQIWEADPVSEFITGSGQLVNVLARDTLNDAVIDASLQSGLAINIKERTTGSGSGSGGIWDVVLSSTVTENTFNIVQCTGVPTLSLELRIADVVYPRQFGALDTNLEVDEPINDAALFAAFDFAAANKIFVDVSGGPFRYATTIDLSTATGSARRTLKMRGDTDDHNNVGEYNLHFNGTGYAIDCQELVNDGVGLRGGTSKNSDVIATRHGIRANESVTHTYAWLMGFRHAYTFTGGFYHKISKGGFRQNGTCYMYDGIGLNGLYIDARHVEFDVGVSASGSNGPLILGGFWESFVTAVVTTQAGEPTYPIFMEGIYVETGSGLSFTGITDNPADTYAADQIMILARQNLEGTFSSINSSFTKFFNWSLYPNICKIQGLHDGNNTGSIVHLNMPEASKTDVTIHVKCLDSPVGLTAINVGPEFAGGQFTDPINEKIKKQRNREDTFVNSWANNSALSEGKGIVNYKDYGGLVTTNFGLDGGSATDDKIAILPDGLRPEDEVRIEVNGGILTVATDGEVSCTSRATNVFGVTVYQARGVDVGAVKTFTITAGGTFTTSDGGHDFTQASTGGPGNGTGVTGTATISGGTVTAILFNKRGENYLATDTITLNIPTATQVGGCILTVDSVEA